MKESLEEQVERMLRVSAEQHAKKMEFLSTQPEMRPCGKHPNQVLYISEKLSGPCPDGFYAGYGPCPLCEEEARRRKGDERMILAGCPQILAGCRLSEWKPRNEDEDKVLQSAWDFVKVRKGFFLLCGGLGVGKSHLAVGIARKFPEPLFRKQNTLLMELRRTYHDRDAADPIPLCQEADLFVLDEVGVSVGGKDELPMLNQILDFRYGEFRPTVLTTNLSVDQLANALDDRLADRIRQSAFAIHTIAGPSHRKSLRESYFSDATIPPKRLRELRDMRIASGNF